MSSRQVSQSARNSRVARYMREGALRTGVQTNQSVVQSWAKAWRAGKVASFEIPAEYRAAATK